MEQEKKKRIRPTLSQVMALEKELADTAEKLRLQLHADKCLAEEVKELESKLADAQAEMVTLGRSNKYMEEELSNLRYKNEDLDRRNDSLCNEVFMLEHRGFFARLFNLK